MTDSNTCVIDVNNGKLKLACRQGMTVFAGLRTHKVYLPTGCGARGECGQCKIKILAGEANPCTEPEMKLIPGEERNAGFRLGCQVRLSGNISIKIPEYVFPAREHKLTLAQSTPLTHDINRFSFSLEPGDRIPHLAGQFLNLTAKVPGADRQPIRCFSFATPSAVEDKVDIIVRLNPRGIMTPYLFEKAKAGDTFTAYAPFGDFYLRQGDAPSVWIAGGSGLAPFLGMIQDLIDKGNSKRAVQLFFGAVKPDDLYYVDLFHSFADKYPWFSFIPALSGDQKTDKCKDYGLITDVVAKHVGDASKSEAYLCGSPGMIGACVNVLCGKGIDRDRIYYDRF